MKQFVIETWRTTKVYLLAGLAVAALVATYLLAVTYIMVATRPSPVVPAGYTLIAERLMGCTQPFLPEAYARGYASPRFPDTVSLATYGRIAIVSGEPFYSPPKIWVFYPDDGGDHAFRESTYRIVTVPGQSDKYLTAEELKQQYPTGPCEEALQ